jgi:tetratricopeptide (TPR) repeat protein
MGHEESMPNARRGLMLAITSRHEEVAAEAAILLAHLQADRTPDVSRARDWIDIASAILADSGKDHPILETWRLQALATVYEKEGNTTEALRASEQALSLIEKAQGREHLDYAIGLVNKGEVLSTMKRLEEAENYYQRAVQVATKVGGPNHPLVAMALANSAEVLNGLHRFDEARAAAEGSLRIWRRAKSSRFLQGFTLLNLAEAHLGDKRSRDAAATFEEALGLLRDDTTPYPETARFGLARALWESQEAGRPRAIELAREAEAGYRRLGLQSAAANVSAWLNAHPRRLTRKIAP